MKTPVLSLQGLRKSYGPNKVLDGISLEVGPGALVSLVGPNGAGKSTLLRLLMRTEFPDAGDAHVLGRSIHEDDPAFNADIGYVSETLDYRMPRSMTKVAGLLGGLHARWDQALFDELVGKFGLPLANRPDEVSRGQKMQFAFALAMAARPRLLILDEITAVLDASVRLYVMNHLKAFTQTGGTVLIATNILSEVQHFADRLVIIGNGGVIFDQATSEFARGFAKYRARPGDPAPAGGREVGVNSDGSVSYLVPREHRVSLAEDQRGITPEDLFIYHSRKVG